jgi:hypothetical protein
MGTTAMDTGGGKVYAPAPAGSHRSACVAVIDLGHQTKNFSGETSVKHEVLLTWELVDEQMEDGRPFTLSRTFTLSLHEKAGLRKFLDSWRGVPFTEKELKGWDIAQVNGKPCMLTVVHVAKGDRTYANVAGASKLPKGMSAPTETHNDPRYYDIDSHAIPADMPKWIAEKIRQSEEYKSVAFDDQADGAPDGGNGHKLQPAKDAAANAATGSSDDDSDDCPF